MIVTKLDIAIAISDYLEKNNFCFDYVLRETIARTATSKEVEKYLKAAATILCKKKNWIIVNEFGQKVKFTKTSYSKNKELYVDNCVYEHWFVVLKSEDQQITANYEYNCTRDGPMNNTGVNLSELSEDQKEDKSDINWDLF